MKSIHENRASRAARFIAARLESEPEVRLYARTEHADWVLFRIHQYLNRYCGSYCFSTVQGDPTVIVTKNRG